MNRRTTLALIAVMTVGLWACDEDPEDVDAGTDAGPTDAGPADAGPTDAGPTDAGPTDSGPVDAGPEETFSIRVVHNTPGMTGTTAAPGSAHLCAWVANAGTILTLPPQFLTESIGPIPFRGVSSYIPFPVLAPLDYVVGVYEPEGFTACPADPGAAGATPAVLIATLPSADVPVDSFSTAIITGLAPNTLGASGDALPSICNAAAAAPTFNVLCTTAVGLTVIRDDRTEPAAGMTRFRVSNQVANSTPPSGFTVCYDPGLVPNPPPATGCVDTTPTVAPAAGDQEALAAGVPYGTVTDYADRDPIAPTGSPAAGVGGGLYLVLEGGTGCTDFVANGACYPMLGAAPAGFPDEVRFQVEDGAINTIFISGALPPGAPYADDFGASMFVWQDNLAAP